LSDADVERYTDDCHPPLLQTTEGWKAELA